jgi:hypothetical protein
MESQLKKALDLVRRIGSHLVVYNLGNEREAYIVMSLTEYERLVLGKNEVKNLTEDELLAKINRDIAIWKAEQEERFKNSATEADFGLNEAKISKDSHRNSNTDADYAPNFSEPIAPEEPSFEEIRKIIENRKEKGKREIKKKKGWQIPTDRKQAAEEIIEEDTQYLEEI